MGHWERNISFNGKSSWDDFGAIILDYQLPMPDKRDATVEDVPFSQGTLNYTNITGRSFYNSRTLEYEFWLPTSQAADAFVQWILTADNDMMEDDYISTDYKIEISVLDEPEVTSYTEPDGWRVHVYFRAQPYYICNTIVEEMLNEPGALYIVNNGEPCDLYVVADTDMTIIVQGITYTIAAGETLNVPSVLLTGDNVIIVVSGTGSLWHYDQRFYPVDPAEIYEMPMGTIITDLERDKGDEKDGTLRDDIVASVTNVLPLKHGGTEADNYEDACRNLRYICHPEWVDEWTPERVDALWEELLNG